MIGLLDPALFLFRAEADIINDLENVLRASRAHKIELTPLREYWPDLWSQLGRTLEGRLSPAAKHTLQAVRSSAPKTDTGIGALPGNAGIVWRRGFTEMFGNPHLQPEWTDRMAFAVIRAVSSGRPVVVFCRRMVGRNLVIHSAGNSTLHENKRWLLHVQPNGVGPCQVLCVHHPRNLRERWTSRFDWRLPTEADRARYPFCVPTHWWKGSITAFGTVASKHAWIDGLGNGWARPNINGGAGYHWDVFIHGAATKQAIGVDQINVVEFGAPPTEWRPGHLHHVPSAKQAAVTDAGWSC